MTDAHTLTEQLGGRWHGQYGVAPCPICQPEQRRGQNALTLSDSQDGRLLLHCKKSHCDFASLIAAMKLTPGQYSPPDAAILAQREQEARHALRKRTAQARRVWDEASPIGGTIAEVYLRSRGISCQLPSTLRFHSACWHGATTTRHPAMIALVEGGLGFAIHRTYLSPNGSGKANIDPSKTMLGPVSGGAVRLSQGAGRLVVAEGIETALSLSSGLLAGPMTLWAALSSSGLTALHLPGNPGVLTIASDGDDAGRQATHELATRADALGWQVELLPAPDGRDWNDILNMKGDAA